MSKTVIKTYKFRLYPSKAQIRILEHTLDLCRELYNAALQERRDAWKLNKISLVYYDQQNQLPEIKKIREDLNSVYSQVLCDVLRRLDKTFKSFFGRVSRKEKAGFPRFKSANRFNSFCYTQKGFSLTDNKLTLTKIGKLKIKLSRQIIGKVKTCTIKRDVDKWFIIFTVETLPETLPKTGKQIGIDAGIENFITLSDGTQVKNPRCYESLQKKLRVAERRISRRKKGSKRRRKAVLQLRKIHRKIRNQRNDFQHKLSTKLVKDFDLIAIEKLNILGMSKGILAKQINDAAWCCFFNMLRYKAESADKKLMEVNPNGTSQTCLCGHREKKTLSQRQHNCDKCGLSIHRDILSAKIVLKLGLGQELDSASRTEESLSDVTHQAAESVSEESAFN